MPKTKRQPAESLADWRTIENEREKYAAYLCSREWGVLKEVVHKRSGGTCERCRILPGNAVHHLTYERKYHEEIEDLQHTCHACHDFTHGKSEFDPIGIADTERSFPVGEDVRRWVRYLKCCIANNTEPVSSRIAYCQWRQETWNELLKEDIRAYGLFPMVEWYRGYNGNVSVGVADDCERFESGVALELAIDALCSKCSFSGDVSAWLRFGAPGISEELHGESIRQVRKCL